MKSSVHNALTRTKCTGAAQSAVKTYPSFVVSSLGSMSPIQTHSTLFIRNKYKLVKNFLRLEKMYSLVFNLSVCEHK